MSDFINTIDVLGDDVVASSIVDRTIAEIADDIVTSIGSNAFKSCTRLTSVNFPSVTEIGSNAFCYCAYLTSVNFPSLTSVGTYAFQECMRLANVDFPLVTTISNRVFYKCTGLENIVLPSVTKMQTEVFMNCSYLVSVDLPSITTIPSKTFYSCYRLTTLILRSETMCSLSEANSFSSCHHMLGTTNTTYNPNGLHDGYIYVPRALVESYQSDSVWSSSTLQFRALEDYTVDGTITGELDESKI